MAPGKETQVRFEMDYKARLLKWKIKAGSVLSQSTVLFLYDDKLTPNDSENENISTKARKFKTGVVGTVSQVLVQEGEIIEPGCILLTIQGCSHPIVMKDMCAECGADLKDVQREKQTSANVAMVHCIPELMVSQEQAEILGQADEQRLLELRKLVLLVDLDQTLIHTTNDEIPPNIRDVYHFQLYGARSPWYHTRLRPGTMNFLKNMSKLFELHICTFGARPYAHIIAHFLDKDGSYFSHRILSRDECFSQNSKTANLKALFPCGDSLVCIIDDREDVWNFTPNLVHVKPYTFFKHTGDINAPPGLTKTEHDSDDPSFEFLEAVKGKKNGDKSYDVLDLSTKVEDPQLAENVAVDPKNDLADSNIEELEEPKSENDKEKDADVLDDNVGSEISDVGSEVSDVEGKKVVVVTESEDTNDDGATSTDKVENGEKGEVSKIEADDEKGGKGEEMIDVNDKDDYLLYLSDILKTIHQAYYDIYDQLKQRGQPDIPDLKNVVPYVRRKILKGVFVVFSGVYPTNMAPEKSRAWLVAKAFGAEIHQSITPCKKSSSEAEESTTHVIAARLGTAKVNEAKKRGLYIVTPEWLWCCAERWERVDELLFPLVKDLVIEDHHSQRALHDATLDSSEKFTTPGSTQQKEPQVFPTYDRVTGKRIIKKPTGTVSKKVGWAVPSTVGSNDVVAGSSAGPKIPAAPAAEFATTINPLLSFSCEDIEKMDREVEDILDGSESEEDEDKKLKKLVLGKRSKKWSGSESTSSQEDNNVDPRCSAKRRKGSKGYDSDKDEVRDRYPRCELPSDSERSSRSSNSDEFNESIGSVDEEMAAAVEREFLGL